MTQSLAFVNATLILPGRLLSAGKLFVRAGRIEFAGRKLKIPRDAQVVDLQGDFLAPGFIDLHVHGGQGHDFMDGTDAAFRAVCQAHARHGTTRLLPTSTVARHDQILAFLECCRRAKETGTGGAAVVGAHFYGPYFWHEAKGCHPGETLRPPTPREFDAYLEYADCMTRATVAPELPGAAEFVRACRDRGVGCNVGHSYASFEQMTQARSWGVTHVDHLFCAMSDRARMRLTQTYPMRGGVMEATLLADELTTEVIADGKHLCPELLKLAYKCKGPDRLALVTDANRALDMPDGPYIFGPLDGGEPILRQDGVGVMPDGKSLASGVVGLDHAIKTFHELTGAPLPEVVRMASLTPARIAGIDHETGSLSAGKRADLVVLDPSLAVRRVYLDGNPISPLPPGEGLG